jgi:hypothetical protein
VVGCCKHGDEPLGSGTTELVVVHSYVHPIGLYKASESKY